MHANAKLTTAGRALLVHRVQVEGWPVRRAAVAQGVSRTTAYRWLHRYRVAGLAGLTDRSSRPHTCPRALPAHRVRRILRARQRLPYGPHRLARSLRCPPSTIYAVLRRHGLSRRPNHAQPAVPVVRYERAQPGELVHLDVKKLGRIPDGGGHRVHGWAARHTGARRQGNEYLHVAVDDRTRLAFAQLLPDERAPSCAVFLQEAVAFFAGHGVRVQAILTDNARAYTAARIFQDTRTTLGLDHLRTRPYRPQTNGKAERFIKTALHEWAYRRAYPTNHARTDHLPRWLTRYNHHRPHTALGGRSPLMVCQQRLQD
jgi:transposase InsO family protein